MKQIYNKNSFVLTSTFYDINDLEVAPELIQCSIIKKDDTLIREWNEIVDGIKTVFDIVATKADNTITTKEEERKLIIYFEYGNGKYCKTYVFDYKINKN